jgi:hypothetical protein
MVVPTLSEVLLRKASKIVLFCCGSTVLLIRETSRTFRAAPLRWGRDEVSVDSSNGDSIPFTAGRGTKKVLFPPVGAVRRPRGVSVYYRLEIFAFDTGLGYSWRCPVSPTNEDIFGKKAHPERKGVRIHRTSLWRVPPRNALQIGQVGHVSLSTFGACHLRSGTYNKLAGSIYGEGPAPRFRSRLIDDDRHHLKIIVRYKANIPQVLC